MAASTSPSRFPRHLLAALRIMIGSAHIDHQLERRATTPATASSPLERPSRWQERAASRLLLALAPKLPPVEPRPTPKRLEPYERVSIARSSGQAPLDGLLFPTIGRRRAVVLMVHPWLPWGQAYFQHRGRIQLVRDMGFDALTFDLGGFGRSGPRPPGFHDRDIEDALDHATQRADGAPVLLWGISFGGYWSHPVLARRPDVPGAVFEDVCSHLITWSRRSAPWGLPCYLFMQHVFADAYRYYDMRRHAAGCRLRSVAYISGADDPGVPPEETRALASLAGGRALIVDDAGHLESIRRAGTQVLDLARSTFEDALA